MKRIEKIDPDTLTGEPRQIFEQWSPGGKPLNIVLIYFRNIELNRNWSYMATHLFWKNSVSDRQREIVVLRTSWQCASDYEFIQHVRIAREGRLLSNEEICDLTNETPQQSWSEHERALISASDELVASHGISDETWTILARHFDDNQLMDIVATAGGYTLNSMATSSFGVDIEETMKREDGLSPSQNGPAFRFVESDYSIATPRAARMSRGNLGDLRGKAAAQIAAYQGRGHRAAFLETLARYPNIVKNWMPVVNYIDHHNTLDPRERLIIGLRTATQCHSEAEFADRAGVARESGLSDVDIDNLSKAAPQLSGSDRHALLIEAVDELVDEKVISDDLWARMGNHFSDEELMDVVFAVATQLMISWMQNALGVQPGQDALPKARLA
jgi:alkylhydroperoxidase family enzyme